MTRYNPPQHPDDRHHGEKQTQYLTSTGQQLSVQLRDLSNQLTSLVDEIKSNNKETEGKAEERSKKQLFWMERSTNAARTFSIVSALLACATLWVLMNQTTIMSNQAIIMWVEQRAWVSIDIIYRSMEDFRRRVIIAENAPLSIIARVENKGKTLAKRIRVDFVVEKVSADKPPSFDYSGSYTGFTSGTINPDDFIEFPVFLHSKDKPITSDPPLLTKADMEELTSGKAYLAMFGEVSYCDVSGTKHWARSCSWYNLTDSAVSARACTEYNDVDNNQLNEKMC